MAYKNGQHGQHTKSCRLGNLALLSAIIPYTMYPTFVSSVSGHIFAMEWQIST